MTIRSALAASCIAWATAASAGLFPTYPLGTTPGTWQPDRYPPATFANTGTVSGRPNVLDLGLSSADGQANRPSEFSSTFYNTQGRGFAVNQASYAVLYGSVWLPSAWSASTGASDARRTGLWGVLSPATGGDTCDQSNCNLFPILSFTNGDPNYPASSNPDTGRYEVFDGNAGGYVDIAPPVSYDQWNDLCVVWTGADIRHYVNGALIYTQTDLTLADPSFGPPTQYTRMIIQGYNYGASFDVNWSGLGAGTVSGASVTGSGQSTGPLTPFPHTLAVTVLDAAGAPIPCVPVTFTAPASGASATLSDSTVLSDRNGVAAVTATANDSLGSYSVSISLPGVADPPAFRLTNTNVPLPLATPIPTLSPALLAALGLLLCAFAAVRLRPGSTKR